MIGSQLIVEERRSRAGPPSFRPPSLPAFSYLLLGLAIVAAAFWITQPISLLTKLALLSLPGIVVSILLHRQTAGYLLLLLLPFGAVSLREGVELFGPSTVIIVALWLLCVLLVEPIRVLKFDATDALVALFCSVSAISVLLVGRRELLAEFLFAYGSVFAVYFVVSRCVTSMREARIAVASLCLGLAIAGALALLVPGAASSRESGNLIRIGMVGRAEDPFAGIGLFGGELLAAVVLTWTAFPRWTDIRFLVLRVASIFTFIAFLATYSRAAVVGFVIAVLAWALVYPRRTRSSRAFVVLVLVGLSFAFAPAGLRERFRSLQYREQESLSRVAIWKGGVAMFTAHPVFGVGVGNYAGLLPSYLTNAPLSQTNQDGHSIFVASFAEMGLVGLVAVALMFGRLFVESVAWMRSRPRESPSPATSAPKVSSGTDSGTEWRFLSAGLFLAFLAFLPIAATTDLSRGPFLFALAGLVHGAFRMKEQTSAIE